jgi:uncharacterized protein (TIGR03083 family)
MPALPPPDYMTALRQGGAAFRVAAGADTLDHPVPACPDWTLGRLVGHLGRVYRAQADTVRRGGTEPPTGKPPAPPSGEAVLAYFDDALATCVDVLAGADPGAPAWNFSGANLTAGFWQRRMAHETAMHRVDAQQATGEAEPIESRLAADGIDELLDALLPRVFGSGPIEGLAGSLHLHATDALDGAREASGEWYVELAPSRARVAHRHAKADSAVRATASDLLLLLWGRLAPQAEQVAVYGDSGLLRRWQQAIRL